MRNASCFWTMSSWLLTTQRLCSFLACTGTLSYQHCDHVHAADSRPVCGNRNICPVFCSHTLYTQLMWFQRYTHLSIAVFCLFWFLLPVSFGNDGRFWQRQLCTTLGRAQRNTRQHLFKHIIQMWPLIWITLLRQDWIIMFALLLRNVCVILLRAKNAI